MNTQAGLKLKMRELYPTGQRFRVVKAGARFVGIVSFGASAWAGWSKPLAVGDVITCDGWRPGMDNTPEAVNFSGGVVPDNALWAQVWPMSGLFRPYPMEGYLEPIDEGEI